ncbi:hypothetical protein MPSEU_000211600 [Mayamaea pseudoterrestris]|nr:hypothetical protein MPSEU_000211600 [Mayamaea pseudoterrestris]
MHTPSSPPQRRGTVGFNPGSLPVPPLMMSSSSSLQQSQHRPTFAQNMAESMTIDEMRQLHQRALSDAEAKRTELQLVLASRYRELVGSSDEVIRMKERSQELHDLVHALPTLMEKLSKPLSMNELESKVAEEKDGNELSENAEQSICLRRVIQLRHDLSSLPRLIHRLLDKNNVHEASVQLIHLFNIIAGQSDAYPLANQLATIKPTAIPQPSSLDPSLRAQMKMVYLQMMTLPGKITRIAKRNLLRSASYGIDQSSTNDRMMTTAAARSAAALAAVNMLEHDHQTTIRATALLDIYFDSKAKLLVNILEKLSVRKDLDESLATNTSNTAIDADVVLSKIVLILQYDIVLHPHFIFCRKGFATLATLPTFETFVVQAKVSKFLAKMLPLVRSKAKSVLVNIAGTTAAALGQIRQSLYDKTDGAEVTKSLEWTDATRDLVSTRDVFQADTAAAMELQQRQFSLWSALFSATFSSLVNSLLSTVFGSVHSNVVAMLTASLANAPALASIQPHEAYRKTLQIAVHLDQALLKVSEDAHELLVHAEEREESERRLRQSLYVQTCEILGRLLHELRRMAVSKSANDADATKALIIGRLCFLLKFRLTALPKLLDAQSSPAALQHNLGMIAFVDLQSAFELADDDEDGVIRMAEALEAVDSAFSGTQFRGAEMLRETLLLDRDGSTAVDANDMEVSNTAPFNVTLHELTLLTARGLRHDSAGSASALGTVQAALDSIVAQCFSVWAKYATSDSATRFKTKMTEFVHEACTEPDMEWNRLHPISNVSHHLVGFVLDLASILNRTVCPSDSISPVPSTEYAVSLGVTVENNRIPRVMDTVRFALIHQGVFFVSLVLNQSLISSATAKPTFMNIGTLASKQLNIDLEFLKACFVERMHWERGMETQSKELSTAIDKILTHCRQIAEISSEQVGELVQGVLTGLDAWLASLLGESMAPSLSAIAATDFGFSSSSSSPIFPMPLVSSVRFNVLPVQADRSLNEIQLREKYVKEKEAPRSESLGGSVMSSGLGFMSSGLGFFKGKN